MSISFEDLQEQLSSYSDQHIHAKSLVAHLSGAIQAVEQQIRKLKERESTYSHDSETLSSEE